MASIDDVVPPPAMVADRLPDRQTFVREPRVQAPLHPLSYTSWFPIHGDAFARVFEEFGIPVAGVDNRRHLGRVYTRTVPLIDRGKDGADPPPFVLKLLLRVVPSIRRRTASALAWNGEAAIEGLIDSWERDGRASTWARTRELRRCDVAAMIDDQLADHVDEIQRHLRRAALDHFRLTVGAVALPMGRLGLFVEDRLGWSTVEVFTLVQGFGHASVAHSRELGELIERLGPEQLDEVIANPATLLDHPAAEHYLERFGHVVHFELAEPTEADDPRIIANHLRHHRTSVVGSLASDPTEAAREAEARAIRELRSADDRATFGRLLALARRGRPLGDETENTVLSALSLMRRVALEAGRRWAAVGRLQDIDDIWFLELDEMQAMLRSPSTPAPDIGRRRHELRWAHRHRAPDHVGPSPPPMLPPSIVGRKFRSTLGAVFWSFAAMEGESSTQPDEQHLLHGLPGSPGTVSGTARIVRDVSEFGRLEPGDILVCPMTTASWSPVFAIVAGIVTEQGGPLSHPAILAREYGLPAVLSAPGATQRIADGACVQVDGAAGIVEILDGTTGGQT